MDDPLRVLRVIRFASRFNYSIDDEIFSALASRDSIRQALREKISRERVGMEIKKMLTGPNPFLSLSLIRRCKIWTSVFWGAISMPPQTGEHSVFTKNLDYNSYEQKTACQGWEYVKTLSALLDKIPFKPAAEKGPKIEEKEDLVMREIGARRIESPLHPSLNYIMYLAAALLPHRGNLAYKPGFDRGATIPVVENICRFFLKVTYRQRRHGHTVYLF